MKTIRLGFFDFPGPFNPERILALLRQRFTVVLDQDKPDYVIYSVFGHDFLKYKRAVRICFTSENVIPDFNLCDYAFGYHWLDFGDRYYRCPNYQLYDQYSDLRARRRSLAAGQSLAYAKPKFCNFIYSNNKGHPIRDELFHHLHARKPVESAGSHLRNVDAEIGPAYRGDWTVPKVEFQKQYRFTVAFENSSSPGYTTEKLVHALAADTVPIYWGNPAVGREFNTARMVNCHEFDELDEIVEHVLEIDADNERFNAMLREPFFPGDQPPAGLSDDAVLDQFARIFEQELPQAYRRNFHFWGHKYESRVKQQADASGFLSGNRLASRLARYLRGIGRS
ncbi:MAG: hypothetical protein HKO62_07725 [Gammaproteobacteria bacterium]|nr:hypothetical protein [Gammaproteobacteria bacterium]